MSAKRSGKDRLWRAVWQQGQPFLLAAMPVLDLPSRYRVRRLAVGLVKCDPWPGMAATGEDAAQLAILRLRWLQHDTRRAVRSRQGEAAVMLARVSIETLITGLYCLYEQDAVAKLQAENIRNLPLLLKFLTDAGVIPASVLNECIGRLGYGQPAKGPAVEVMATFVDKAVGARAAVDLYDRFYRPSSALTLHGGGLSLLRHVREDGQLTRQPDRTWARRSPARIADACLGALTANMARRAGRPSKLADNYTQRHFDRALAPMIVSSSSGIGKLLMPRQILATMLTVRGIFRYARSGQDAAEPAVRVARIRAGMERLLLAGVPDFPQGSLDPFLDYVSEKIAAETAPEPEEGPSAGRSQPAH
jgi:hypothetical protein